MSLLALLQPPISVMNPARTSPRELRASLWHAAIFAPPLFAIFVGLALLDLQAAPRWSLTQGVLQSPCGSVGLAGIVAALVIGFAGSDVLEARLPAPGSRAASHGVTGAAPGVHSSVQFLGTFLLAVAAAWRAIAGSRDAFMPAASPAPRS